MGTITLKNAQDQEFTITHPDNAGAIGLNSDTIANKDYVHGYVHGNVKGLRNLIINGDMAVWQRGTSSSSANGYVNVDRFTNQTSATLSQSTDAPQGFKYSLQVSNWIGGGYQINQKIENFGQFYPGQKLTISCYVKGNRSFNIAGLGALYAIGPNVSVVEENTDLNIHTVTTEWTRYSFTMTLKNIDYSTMTALYTYPIGNLSHANATFTTSDTLYVTGFQVEVGEHVTDFEHRPYPLELQLCQRYYQDFADVNERSIYHNGFVFNSNQIAVNTFIFPVPMRTTPTVSFVNPSHISTPGNWGIYGATNGWSSVGYTPVASPLTEKMMLVQFSGVSGVSNTASYICNGGFILEAEL